MAFWSNKDASPARKYRFKMGPAGTNWWYVNSVTLPSFEINTGEYQLLNQKFKYPGIPTWNPVTISIIDTADSVEQVKKVLGAKDFDFLQEEGIEKGFTLGARAALDKLRQEEIEAEAQRKLENRFKAIDEVYYGELERAPADFGPVGAFSDPLNKRNARRLQAENNIFQATRKKIKGINSNDDNDFIIQQMGADGKTFRTWTLVNSFITSVNYGDLDYSSDDLVSIEIVVAYDYATTEKI
jgi:hypothetical protein